MIDINLNTYADNYNSLPAEVEEAYATLQKKPSHLEVIAEAITIIEEMGAQEYLGIFLLHRHFECKRGSIFIERHFMPPHAKGHAEILVTFPIEASKVDYEIAPHRFSISGDGPLNSLEFSTDGTVLSAYDKLKSNPKVVEAVSELLVKKGFSSSLGLGIYARDGGFSRATRVFFEETDFDANASVVHILPHMPAAAEKPIPTLWSLTKNNNGIETPFTCSAYCSGHHQDGGVGYCGHKKLKDVAIAGIIAEITLIIDHLGGALGDKSGINESEKISVIRDILLLWLVRHGGEWPDWRDPDGQLAVALTQNIQNIAKRLKNEAAGVELENALGQILKEKSQ